MCLLVYLSAFYRPHDICPLCGAASEYMYSESSQAVAGGTARARGHACTARARARMPYNFSTQNSSDSVLHTTQHTCTPLIQCSATISTVVFALHAVTCVSPASFAHHLHNANATVPTVQIYICAIIYSHEAGASAQRGAGGQPPPQKNGCPKTLYIHSVPIISGNSLWILSTGDVIVQEKKSYIISV